MNQNSGIYIIINKINGKFYIGSTKNFHKRWWKHGESHIKNLKKGCHINEHLQRAWNKYGEKNFIFLIIEKCPEQQLLEREQFYLDFFKTYDPNIGYNKSEIAGLPGGNMFEKNPSAKITWKEVREIRKQYKTENIKQKDLAEKYNITQSNIESIVNNRSWFDENYVYSPKQRENHPNSKLTEEQAKEIRSLYKTGSYSQKELATMFNVGRGPIQLIIENKTFHDINYFHENKKNPLNKNNHPSAILTLKKVRKIREMYQTGLYTQTKLSEIFHVSRQTIGNIVLNKTWKE